jgi:DNA-binding NtrC family response regulator
MKTFMVYLRDGRIAKVCAETYRHEGDQYLFERPGSSEAQFFIGSEVAGISEASSPEAPTARGPSSSRGCVLATAEADTIVRALSECQGNRTRAAEKLGISRRALIYKLKKLPREPVAPAKCQSSLPKL